MGTIASQITSLTIVYSTVYSDADQRKHQSSAPLAFVRGIHRGPVNSPHKWPVTRKTFPFDDVIMSHGNNSSQANDISAEYIPRIDSYTQNPLCALLSFVRDMNLNTKPRLKWMPSSTFFYTTLTNTWYLKNVAEHNRLSKVNKNVELYLVLILKFALRWMLSVKKLS